MFFRTMPELVQDPAALPLGVHCVSLHAGEEEAADHAVAFLAGAPPEQAASYWVADPRLAAYYSERLAVEAPNRVGCVQVLDREQVEPSDGRLRPVGEIRAFVSGHPEGVTGGADTISRHWNARTVPEHLEYEAWFDEQPRDDSRFLCPYDLRSLPTDRAPEILRALGAHHSHAILSQSSEPAVRLLQLFVFGSPGAVPAALRGTLEWAQRERLVAVVGRDEELRLTEEGERLVRTWGQDAVVDW